MFSHVSLLTINAHIFDNFVGLMQGDILSRLIFSIFLIDFKFNFIASGGEEYLFEELGLFLWLYVDDLVLPLIKTRNFYQA